MPAQGISAAQIRANLAKRTRTVPVVLGFLGLFLVFTTALTLANSTAISIRERRTEVATLRVVGYYPRTLFRMLVSESVLVGFLGGLLAVGVMVVLFRAGLKLDPGGGLPPAKINFLALAAGMVVSIVVPLAGSVPAAHAAVRVPLVDGLRESA
jgi:putative ABC transport system permease protein